MPRYDIILWDIDGTLLRGNGIGRAATAQALQATFGTTAGVENHRFGGKTDWYTLRELLTPLGWSHADIDAHLPAYSRAISEVMAALTGEFDVAALPHARELVAAYHQSNEVAQGIVTGNVAANVPIKLTAAGFDPSHFPFGAYGDEAFDRNDLPKLAWERAQAHLQRTVDPSRVLVVGDTLRDIEAARANGMPVCAVLTGFADPQALRDATPDYLLDDLATFEAVMGT
jgi:phosphoglycolate phosphatase